MRNIVEYYNLAQSSLDLSESNKVVNWNLVKDFTTQERDSLSQMKFEAPSLGEEILVESFKKLNEEIQQVFKSFNEKNSEL